MMNNNSNINNSFDPGGSSYSYSHNYSFNHPSQSPTHKTNSPVNDERFSLHRSSPEFSDSSNTVSFVSLNARGLNSSISTKFDSLMDDFTFQDFTCITLQETHLTSTSGRNMMANYKRLHKTAKYNSYWAYDPSDRGGGVSFILRDFMDAHVQKVHRHKGRYIALDLYLPARKLRLINYYGHQHVNYSTLGKSVITSLSNLISQARASRFEVIIMGDFNTDATVYLDTIAKGRTPPAHYQLYNSLCDNDL